MLFLDCAVYVFLWLMLFESYVTATQICASCTGVTDPNSCHYHITCPDDESCYVLHYGTDSGASLYDLGCMASTECPHYAPMAIVGKRGEGHHVRCEECCNNASMCNQQLDCESSHNQGPAYPRDCSELVIQERVNDTYIIFPHGVKHKPVSVYCIFDDNNAAWTVFQRRFDGSVDFYRKWDEYVRGFGETNGEYWLGLGNIHALTSIPNFELKVVMTDFSNVTVQATYLSFHVDDASTNYRLTVYGYSGTAGDSLKIHNGMMFSTYDKDHDKYSGNCAASFHGAWWYDDCYRSNLNGEYIHGHHAQFAGSVEWYAFRGSYDSLKSTLMMIRKT